MKKLILFSLLFLWSVIICAQNGFTSHAHYIHGNYKQQILTSNAEGFSVYQNQYGAIGGGPTVEFGMGIPLLHIKNQFFVLADGYFRMNAIKRTDAGIGGTACMELRFYDRPRQNAHCGIDLAWGANAMIYAWENEDRVHLLYGGNWIRAGYIRNSRALKTENNYFLELQYWNGSWYTCGGIEFDSFSRVQRKTRVRF